MRKRLGLLGRDRPVRGDKLQRLLSELTPNPNHRHFPIVPYPCDDVGELAEIILLHWLPRRERAKIEPGVGVLLLHTL
jgi:hypothetical protein